MKLSTKPPLWSEGQLLTQQHLQTLMAYQQWLWCEHYKSRPYYYGIESLQLDELALKQGVFAIVQLSAIFPSGLRVHIDSSSNLALKIAPSAVDEPVTVYLYLPSNSAVNELAGYPTATETACWQAKWQECADWFDDSKTAELLLGSYNYQLSTEPPWRNQATCLALAQLRIGVNQSLNVQADFAPAMRNVFGHPVSAKWLNEKSQQLFAAYHDCLAQHQGLVKNGQPNAQYFAVAQLVQSLLIAKQSQYLAPIELYQSLCCCLVQLSESQEHTADYCHDHCMPVLATLFAQIITKLEQRDRAAPKVHLQQTAKHHFRISGLSAAVMSRYHVYFGFDCRMLSEQQRLNQLNVIKLSSRSELNLLKNNATAGVTLETVAWFPTMSNAKVGFSYFLLAEQELLQKTQTWFDELVLFHPFIEEVAAVDLLLVEKTNG